VGGLEARVTGQEQLSRLSGKLREAAPEIQKAFNRTMRTTAREGIKDVKHAAEEKLPKAGGLNDWVASATFGVRIRPSGKSASLRLVASKPGHDLAAFNAGSFRHPVYANAGLVRSSWTWRPQTVTPGFWSETLEHERDNITRALLRNMSPYTRSLRHI
jgi:hypothetical protein